MKHYIYLLLLLIFISCEQEDTNGVPAFIKIDSINLEATTNQQPTENITDAWVYVNDQLQGVYELPAQFPILNLGSNLLRIKAGIKDNGIATNRIPYPFYASYFEQIDLIADQVSTINPTVKYLDSLSFFYEDFEGIGLDLETTNNSDTIIVELMEGNNNYGAGFLTDSILIFEIATDELLNLPKAGAPVFLELDYKCNVQFLVGVFVNSPGLVEQKDLVWVTPKQEWSHIYINLTSIISESTSATSFKVFIGMQRDFNLVQNELYFDNLKVVY